MKKYTRKRLLIFSLVCVIASSSIYFLSTQIKDSRETKTEKNAEIVKDESSANDLLDTISQAEVLGFYRSEERGGAEMFGGEVFMCDQLVITKGAEKFGKEYREMVERGNTVNQFDQEGRLVLNLDLSELDNETKTNITSSSQEDEVLVELEKLPQGPGRGVGPCYSFVKVVTAK